MSLEFLVNNYYLKDIFITNNLYTVDFLKFLNINISLYYHFFYT